MSPNNVRELLDALIAEFGLPLVASDSGPLLVSEQWDVSTQSMIGKMVEQCMNGDSLSYSFCVGRSVSERDEAITRLAADTHRAPEVKEILESLVVEQSLPLKVVDDGFQLEILVDERVDYRCDDMVKLETLLEEADLDVPVRHNGFSLRQEENSGDLQFSQFETLANRLASALDGYGLQVRLLHHGFELHKSEEAEVDIAEAQELTYRLETMVGIRYYVQNSYRDIKPGLDTEIHWTVARITTALP
jgi:hypothetical protein